MFTAAMLVATLAAACGCACSSVIVSRRGHQCKYRRLTYSIKVLLCGAMGMTVVNSDLSSMMKRPTQKMK